MENNTPIVIDNGTGLIKAGPAGEDAPSACFPSCIGRPKLPASLKMTAIENRDFYVGEEALAKKGILSINYPLEHGIVNNWDDMELIWYHAFYNEMRLEPSEHPVMLTEAPLNPKQNREKMTQIFFETFEVPSFTLQIQALLALYSAGRTTGIVVDSGDGVTHTIPIFEGYAMQHAIKRINLAGRNLTRYMQKILTEIGQDLQSSSGLEIAKQIKQQCCYVAEDPEQEQQIYDHSTEKDKIYELPDMQQIAIKSQRYRCPELLFNPMLEGHDFQGVHQLVFDSIMGCDIDVRKDLYKNIVLSGGTTLFEGFSQRLTNEIVKLAPATAKVTCVAVPERQYSVWLGGSILSTLSSFTSNFITKAEYEEEGVNIVHKRCF